MTHTGSTLQGLTIDTIRHEVRVDGASIELGATEFRLLLFLSTQPGRVFTRMEILNALHGERHDIAARSVDVQIVSLRRRLGPAAALIETVRGFGYRFKSHTDGEDFSTIYREVTS